MAMTKEDVFAQLRAHCMGFDGAVEERPWEHMGWKVGGKLFAIGGEGSNVLTVKSTLDQQAALVELPFVERAAYVGRFGWVTLTIRDEAELDLARRLIDESYAAVAMKKKRR